jgi:16S rRNA (uracil1498-N3)-methyltransferase
MRLIRCFIDAELIAGSTIDLNPRAAQHLLRVLRLKSGDEFNVFNGRGSEFSARIASVRGDQARVAITGPYASIPESGLAITLVQGVSRGDRMDYVIQKATELGVTRIIPVLCERSVVRLDDKQAQARLTHWQGVAIAACEQSGRAQLPAIELPGRLLEYFARLPSSTNHAIQRVILDPEATSGLRQLPSTLASIELLVGPEGGLSSGEVGLAKKQQFTAIRLGPRILRTETAAAAALAVLQALHGDLA